MDAVCKTSLVLRNQSADESMQPLKQTGEPATVANARAVERFQKHETHRAEDVVGEVLWHQLLQPHFLRRTLVAEHADHVVAAE